MLILQGNSGKSQVVSILAGQTDSCVFVYAYDPPIIDGCTIVRRSNATVGQLIKYINEEMRRVSSNGKQYNYLVIYTDLRYGDTKLKLIIHETRFIPYQRDNIIVCCKSKNEFD